MKCFNIDVRICSFFYPSAVVVCLFVSSWLFCHFDIDVCIYSTCTFFDCQADFDVDNVQRRELINVYGA